MVPLELELIKRSVNKVSKIRNPWNDFDWVKTYYIKYAGQSHTVSIVRSSKMYFLPKILIVHDPNEKVLKHIEQFLLQLDYYHVKEMKLTFDFENDDRDYIRQFIKSHFVINWRGKCFYHPSETFYFNNIRFGKGKGSRLYDKQLEKDDQAVKDVVRLEMLMKRPILQKNSITNINDIINFKPEVISRYFNFKEFNYRRCKKRLLENGKEYNELKSEFDTYKDLITRGKMYDLNRSIVKKYKKYPSDGFLQLHSFNSHFLRQISGKSFLNRDSVMVTIGQMGDKIFDADTMSLMR